LSELRKIALSVADKWPGMPASIRAYLETGKGADAALDAVRAARKTVRGRARAVLFAALVAIQRRDSHAMEDVQEYAREAG